jgi:beta-phosphoglucomutase family hydrolase
VTSQGRHGLSAISSGLGVLGLPRQISACLFDLDGVLTDTARVHAAAGKEMFDCYLRARAEREHTPFVAFDPVADYDAYVDGKPRADGTRAFLASRAIDLPEGHPGDRPDAQTVQGLGNRKNEIVLRRIHHDGVQAYPGSVAYARAVRDAGLRRAVVSSSTHCHDVLIAAHIEDLFEQRIDGLTAQREQLAGKPAPDMFLAAAHALGVEPGGAAVFEDALAGVAAGRAGGFGYVIGVDRVGQAEQLLANGADTVVTDLADLMSHR